MERVISIDERIRRAEELYYKRKMQGGVRVASSSVNNKKSDFSILKKMIIQILICMVIYIIFYGMRYSQMFFSNNLISQTKEVMSYDLNFKDVYLQIVKVVNENIVTSFNETENQPSIVNSEEEKTQFNNEVVEQGIQNNNESLSQENPNGKESIEQQNENESIEQEILGMGGESDKTLEVSGEITNNIQKSQMEIDAEYVKNNFNIEKPLQGVVTSRFGPRQPTEIISANHKGIDIGANTGTQIYAAMEGTVIAVSNYGDYGKHLKISNGNVVTLYAHCNQINVSVGQSISKGQEIAKVGSTGRTTGPHLHFEIQVDGRVVNPDYVLNF